MIIKRIRSCGKSIKDENTLRNGHNNSFYGKHHSEETKKRLSEMAKNRPPVSEETRRKLSEAGKGRIHTEETLRKLSLNKTAEKHHNWNGGIKTLASGRVFIRQGTKEYKARSRIVMEEKLGRELKSSELVHHKNENPSDDRIENLIILNRSKHIAGHNSGKVHSQETKEKIGVKSKGRYHSEESRAKISNTLKQTWSRRKIADGD